MQQNWSQLTRDQKREERMKSWLEGTGIKFRDAKAEAAKEYGVYR